MRSSHSRIERQRRALLAARVLIDRMRVIYGQIERLTDAPVSAQRALACIADDPGIAASQLARVLGIQRSGVSHILKLLVARNWVQRRREADDQRSVQLHLTTSGRRILRLTTVRAAGALRQAVGHLTGAQLKQVDEGLSALNGLLPVFAADADSRRAAPARCPTPARRLAER